MGFFTQINSLEFNEIKAQLMAYLRGQDQFSDYDFEGSSLSVLLDVLAYNTYYSSVNANLLANENFLDSAVMRENVVKLAKLIGYTPRSARSAQAKVDIVVQTPYPYPATVQINKGVLLKLPRRAEKHIYFLNSEGFDRFRQHFGRKSDF